MADRRPDAPDESRAGDRNLGGECDGDRPTAKPDTDGGDQDETEILLGKEHELPDSARDRDDKDLSGRPDGADGGRTNMPLTSSG